MFTFRDLDLRHAEEVLVAGCLDHEYALLATARELGKHPFRSEVTYELDAYYTALLNAWIQGSYSEERNRSILSKAFPEDDFRITEDLYDGNTAIHEYVDALVAALRQTYDAQDLAVRAAEALTETAIYLVPGSPPPAPRPLRPEKQRPKPPERGGHRGGINV